MSDVSVIGLGLMGAALARAFLADGKSVTVWNRSPAKVAALVEAGGQGATTAAEAMAASPVVVICLTDYEATGQVLADEAVAKALAGRLVVQLTSGTPKQARALAAVVGIAGGLYLDGAIGTWPSQIGGPDATIVVSGPDEIFVVAEPFLKLLAGNLTHMGPDIGHAAAVYNAGLAYFAGHWIGFSQGAAICEAEGLDAGMFGEMMSGLSPMFGDDMRQMGSAIARRDFAGTETTLAIAGADIGRLVELSRDLELSTVFPAAVASVFRRAGETGHGGDQPCAVVRTIREAEPA